MFIDVGLMCKRKAILKWSFKQPLTIMRSRYAILGTHNITQLNAGSSFNLNLFVNSTPLVSLLTNML